MKYRAIFLAVTGAMLFSTAKADLVTDLEGLVDQAVTQHGVPGMLVGVWRGDTQVAVFEKGVSDLDTMTPINRLDSLKMGSVTKSFTVTRLLQLHDQGLVDLDTPISDYVSQMVGQPNGNATLRQLANMTSGIFNYSAAPGFALDIITNPLTPRTDSQLVSIANGHPTSLAPGDEWSYSNTNTVLIGMAIEQITGNSIGSEIANHIVAPLGLSSTLYPTAPELPDPHSQGYARFSDEDPPELNNMTLVTPTVTSAAGAMISTLDDLHVWAVALGKGTLLLPETQLERLDMIETPLLSDPEYDEYGLGIGKLDGWIGHTGDFFGYQSLIMYDPLNDQTVVILQNLSGDGHVPTELFREMSGVLAVPEPGTWALLGIGLLMTGWFGRLRQRKRKSVSGAGPTIFR